MRIEVVGVHPVEASEPCHVIELQVEDAGASFDLAAMTQDLPGEPRDNWQVPWDEQFLEVGGGMPLEPADWRARAPTGVFRVVFFFHYLDPGRPLLSPAGPLSLPRATPLPPRLAFLKYDSPG
jgi:hypothetical protein